MIPPHSTHTLHTNTIPSNAIHSIKNTTPSHSIHSIKKMIPAGHRRAIVGVESLALCTLHPAP